MKTFSAQECANIKARREGSPPPFEHKDPHGGVGALTQPRVWFTIIAAIVLGSVVIIASLYALSGVAEGVKKVKGAIKEAEAEEARKKAQEEAEAAAAQRAEDERRAARERAEEAKEKDKAHGWGNVEDYLDFVGEDE
ncbi:hypothetical protein [Mycolicibacter kumamotonensis]|nr:hypothetical protein [Mycolicibacter kumamotonensis]